MPTLNSFRHSLLIYQNCLCIDQHSKYSFVNWLIAKRKRALNRLEKIPRHLKYLDFFKKFTIFGIKFSERFSRKSMENTKLIQLLKTFSNQEFSRFGKFLRSPFFNEGALITNLYNILKKYYPSFDHSSCTKKNIYKLLYKSEEYNEKRLTEKFSELLSLAEKYLSVNYTLKHTIELNRNTLYEYSARGLEVHFDKKNREIKKLLSKAKYKEIEYFLEDYYNESHRNAFYSSKKLLGKRKPDFNELTNEVGLFLKYFCANMILYYTIMSSWEEGLNHKFDFKFYDDVMKYIEDNNMNENPFINALYLRLKIRENKNDTSLFYRLKSNYLENADNLSLDSRNRIITILNNDASRRFMAGEDGFDVERFEVMKFQFDTGILDEEDKWLSREKFINYLSGVLSMGFTEIAEGFLEEYIVKLEPGKRKYALAYSKGLISYYKKEYDSALKELSKIKGGDYVYYIRIKIIYAKIYFEQNDFETVLTLIDALKHYLSSNELIPLPSRKRYVKFAGLLLKLTSLRLNHDEFKIKKLIVEISNSSIEEITTNKSWLLERAKELLL